LICNHQLAVRFCQGAPVLGVCQLTIFMFDTNKDYSGSHAKITCN
jgi:hypothetical protein